MLYSSRIVTHMLEGFFKQSKPMLFRRKETITDSSDPNHIFYLNQGYIKLYTVSSNGNEMTLHIFSPSSIFPILWDKKDESEEYYFESLTPVEVYSAEKTKLQQFILRKPEVYSEITQQLSAFSISAINKLKVKILGNAYQQIIVTLLDLSERFGQKNKEETIINYWFTHQDIASLAGLSRERVTIEIDNLIKKKLIKYDNHFIVIPKIELLKSEIE